MGEKRAFSSGKQSRSFLLLEVCGDRGVSSSLHIRSHKALIERAVLDLQWVGAGGAATRGRKRTQEDYKALCLLINAQRWEGPKWWSLISGRESSYIYDPTVHASAIRRLEQKDCHEFKASLRYRTYTRPGKAIQEGD